MKTCYNESEVQQRLIFYPEWKFENNSLQRTYNFLSYSEAFAFIAQMVIVSEKMKHHPNLNWNYCEIQISITTHDHGGITDKDFQWIDKVQQIWLRHD